MNLLFIGDQLCMMLDEIIKKLTKGESTFLPELRMGKDFHHKS